MMQSEYKPDFPLPKMFPLEQVFPGRDTDFEYVTAVQKALEPLRFRVKPGMRVGLAVGSRGITGLDCMVSTAVELLQSMDARVVILPAMGSHGGASSEGQTALLAGYGVGREQQGVPVEASMETIQAGQTEWGTPIYWSRAASELDGVLILNRIKPHTDFKGNLGSGILKMLVVGLGKRDGASAFHRASIQHGYENVLRTYAESLLLKMPILGGLAVVENALHQTDSIRFLPSESLVKEEEKLFQTARDLMPRLPFDDLDLLIVDSIGKNISGSGMDPNIIGRGVHGYSTDFSQQTDFPRIKRIMVRDLTPESHGNAIGIGMADYTTSRLVRAMDPRTSFVNAVTAMTMNGAKVPIHFESDREVIQWALSSVLVADKKESRILRIRDTLNLNWMEASESLLREARSHDQVRILGDPEEMAFDAQGKLPAIMH
jgi:hypothetical protein